MNNNVIDRFLRFLGRSQFFTYSALIHILLIATIGTRVIYQRIKEDAEFAAPPGGGFVESAPAVAPPPTVTPVTPTPNQAPSNAPSTPTSKPLTSAIATAGRTSTTSFSLPSVSTTYNATSKKIGTTAVSQVSTPSISSISSGRPNAEQARAIGEFTGTWRKGGTPGTISGSSKFKFKAYVAQYKGGDWNSTHQVSNGQITKGALPNLCYMMNSWTKKDVEAEAMKKPLNLASAEIFQERPPFIFFTGTRDFKLTDQEVENLRKYLQVGGAIWGDSSLPGRNSRFDIAFRREMKRVLDDKSIDFEELPMNHPLFNKMKYQVSEIPQGLNFYQEPVYVMKVYGEISVIYTANDYGDMMRIGLDENGQIEKGRDANNQFIAIDKGFWDARNTYFRNLNEDALRDTYEFSINMVIYLLTRWESKLRGTPGM
jgi:hypothetical protein